MSHHIINYSKEVCGLHAAAHIVGIRLHKVIPEMAACLPTFNDWSEASAATIMSEICVGNHCITHLDSMHDMLEAII